MVTKNANSVIEENNEEKEGNVESLDEKRSKRRLEWGQQFDLWLIRAVERKYTIEFLLARDLPGITEDGVFQGIPLRVDAYNIQILVDGSTEVWVSKRYLVTARGIRRKKPEAGSESQTS